MTLIYALFPQATLATIRKSKQTNPEIYFDTKAKQVKHLSHLASNIFHEMKGELTFL